MKDIGKALSYIDENRLNNIAAGTVDQRKGSLTIAHLVGRNIWQSRHIVGKSD